MTIKEMLPLYHHLKRYAALIAMDPLSVTEYVFLNHHIEQLRLHIGLTYRSCAQCGLVMELTRKNRTDTLYCSGACRSKASRTNRQESQP